MRLEKSSVEDMMGKTIVSFTLLPDKRGVEFNTGAFTYVLEHCQDCCEKVELEDVSGDLGDLVGSPLLMAETVSNLIDYDGMSLMWTFYKFATNKGYVTLRYKGTTESSYSLEVACLKKTRG